MLGEAFMKIDESEQAMKAYVAASKESPQDASVASQVGHALVATHNYGKAMEHYESALPIVEDSLAKLDLCYDVAELYFKLKNYERAEELLNKLLANVEDGCLLQENLKSTKTLMLCLRASLLLSKVQNIQRKQGSTTQVAPRTSDPAPKYLHHYRVHTKPPFATFVHVLMKRLDLCCKCYMLYYEMVIAGDVKCKRSSQQLSTRAPWASFGCNPGSEACCC
jgi:tetratricopeptide (TPR) repeat protein